MHYDTITKITNEQKKDNNKNSIKPIFEQLQETNTRVVTEKRKKW